MIFLMHEKWVEYFLTLGTLDVVFGKKVISNENIGPMPINLLHFIGRAEILTTTKRDSKMNNKEKGGSWREFANIICHRNCSHDLQ